MERKTHEKRPRMLFRLLFHSNGTDFVERSGARLKIIMLLVCLCLAPLTLFAQQGQSAEAQAHAAAGLQFAKGGDMGSAERELRRAVEIDAHDEALLADLGTILAMEKKFDESSSVFEQALKINSLDVAARRYLAANLWQQQRFPEAKKNLEIVLQQKPGDAQALLLFGMVSENMKDYAAAAKALASVPALVRARPESMAALARCYYHLGEEEKARSLLQEFKPDTMGPQGVFLGAQIADQMGDYSTAEEMLLQIESTFPDAKQLKYTLAGVEYHANQFERAKTTLTELIASGNKTSQVYSLLAWCDQELHDDADARSAMEQAIMLEPANESNSLDLIKILLAQHRYSAALDVARRTTEAFPSSARAFALKGNVEVTMEQYSDSIRSYGEAVKVDPANPENLLGLAAAQSAGDMNDAASQTLAEARKEFPKDGRVPLEQGLLMMKRQNEDPLAEARAGKMFRMALTLDNSLPDAHYQLGNIALDKGRLTEALSQLRAAEQLSPKEPKIHFALARAYRRLNRNEDAAAEIAIFDKLKSPAVSAPTASLGAPHN